jgi:hypothetical protein
LHKVVRGEVIVGVGTLIHATKGTLHCVDCRYLHLIEHGYSRGCLLGLLVTKAGIAKAEKWTDFRHQVRKEPGLLWRLWIVTTIHENRLSAGVAVEITKHNQLSFLCKLLKKLFRIVYARMEYLGRGLPSSIQIASCKGTSVVTVNDTIWIEHWDDFENKVLSQILSLIISFVSQEFYGALHHPRAYAFTWMDSCGQKDAFPFIQILQIVFGSDS